MRKWGISGILAIYRGPKGHERLVELIERVDMKITAIYGVHTVAEGLRGLTEREDIRNLAIYLV